MFKNAIDVFDIFGFKIRIDPSWLLIAALIVWSLSTSYFPQTVEGLARGEYIALAIVAMLGLFASLIFHELAHSLVSRHFGLKVGGITLFVFGGVAELEQEPRDPTSEIWIAIAGPIASMVLAGGAFFIASLLGENLEGHSLHALVNYVVLVNLVLAIFNMVPAFPLDGGRVLRAVLWKHKNDLVWATKIASRFGSAFGIALILIGALSVLSGTGIGGLWQILIGFFIMSASSGSYQQLLIKTTLKDQDIGLLMTRNPVCVEADETLENLVEEIILGRNVSFIPVKEGEHLLGYVDLDLVKEIDRENWSSTHIADIYIPSSASNTVSPDLPTEILFEMMARNGNRKFLVAEDGRLLGVISLSDLMTFLAIHQGVGKPGNRNTVLSQGAP